MRFFGLKSCDTCTKALKALKAAGMDPAVVDVRKDGVARSDLEKFFAAFADDLVNKRSTTWRGLDDDARATPPVTLLEQHPTLMKRPVIETDAGELFLGWKADVQGALL